MDKTSRNIFGAGLVMISAASSVENGLRVIDRLSQKSEKVSLAVISVGFAVVASGILRDFYTQYTQKD